MKNLLSLSLRQNFSRTFSIKIATLTVFFLSPAALAQSNCSLTVGWEAWFPYAYLDGKGKLIGFDVQLIEALGKESGCEIKFVGRAWSRLLKEVETGETQLAMGATKTAEREAYARFTQFYRMERLGVLVQKNKAQELKATSLKELIALPGAKIGAVTDWEYGDDYETLKKSPQFSEWVELSVRDEVNLRKLEAGRLKAMLVDLASAHVLVEELKMGGAVETHPLILSQADIHFMVSKAGVSEDIYKRLNTAAETMKKSPEVQAIYRQYSSQ